jgi:hypothetical protein
MGKSILKRTDFDNLITNLRGEVGVVIESWTLMREYYLLTNQLDGFNYDHEQFMANMSDGEFRKRNIIKKKLADDVISRLSELAHKSFGKLNFYFATQKLGRLHTEFEEFHDFIINNNFKAHRDEFISHKKLPPTWDGHKAAYAVPYLTILKAIAKALILMKRIDQIYIGENSSLNWQIKRKDRYSYDIPARAKYMQMYYVKQKTD